MPEIPDGAAEPQDRKPSAKKASKKPAKTTDAAVAEATGAALVTEVDGVEYVVINPPSEDFEMLEDLAAYVAGDSLTLPKILFRLLGAEAYDELKERYRDEESGIVSAEKLHAVFLALNAAAGKSPGSP